MDDKKIAVLIDAENVSGKYIKLILDEVSNYGSATYKRLYGDFQTPSVRAWMKNLRDYAITPVFQYNYTQGKNASDSALIIDAMDILYSGNVDGFCIVTSDSDFTKLVLRLRESGMTVIGMGERKTPNAVSNIPNMEEMEKEIISIINTHADDDGWVDLSELGDNLPKRVPGFDPRNYKCTKLKQFIELFDSVEVRSARNPHNKILSIIYVRVKQKEEKPVLSKVRRGGKRKKDADAEEE